MSVIMNYSNISHEQFGSHFMFDGYGTSKEAFCDKEKLNNMLPLPGQSNLRSWTLTVQKRSFLYSSENLAD
jgi:hypothetical protein